MHWIWGRGREKPPIGQDVFFLQMAQRGATRRNATKILSRGAGI